jgi:long-chain acyl-CoA synthetase
MTFASFLASHARRHARKEAVICGGERVTFAELDDQTTRLAQALRDEAGVQVGDRVIVYLPNGVDFVRAFIAVVKAGALAVPVNLPLSASEIAHIIADCTPRAAFVNETTRAVWRRASDACVVRTVAMDEPASGEASAGAWLDRAAQRASLVIPYDADDCMVGYTSGTTGRAKGVILTQSNYEYVNGHLNGWHWQLTASDRHLCTTPLAHRTGIARLMNMILHGATLVVMQRFDAAEAARLVREERITVFGMVPTVGRMMLPAIEARPQDFASVRTMLVTGEAFPMDVKRRLHAALPAVRFHSFYAMTEAGAITWLGHDEQFTHAQTVGRPWPGLDVKLVGADGRDVRTGDVGEVWVRSGLPGTRSTMRGYFNRPKETAETLRDGWVATGDMGRFDDQGYMALVDRKKDMVLSGGYNIYCKEVELVIQALPGVVDVAVIGVPDPDFGEAVAACIELAPGAAPDAAAIVAHCREHIASYKKPKHVFFVDALPRNSSGKVLKNALRDRYRDEHPSD